LLAEQYEGISKKDEEAIINMAHSGFLGKVIILFVSTYPGVSPLSPKGGT